MKKFFLGLLKALGYFAIYFGMQLLVSFVYTTAGVIRTAIRYTEGGTNLLDPVVFQQYMDEALQVVSASAMPTVIISGVLTIGVLWLIFVCRKKKITKELCLRKFHPGAVVPIVLMGLGFNVVTGLVLSFVPEKWMSAYEASSSLIMTDNMVLLILGTVLMAPLVEEIIFRGLLYTRMKKGMPAAAAMVLSSAVFGVAHGQWVWMIYAFVFGMVLVWTFERTKSLLANILLHLSYNACAVLQLLIPEDAPDWVAAAVVFGSVAAAVLGVFWFLKIPKGEEPAELKEAEAAGETAEEVKEFL